MVHGMKIYKPAKPIPIMLSDVLRSRLFSGFLLFSFMLCILASLSYAQECPVCNDFLNRPQAKVLVGVDQDTHVAQINVYYDNATATPSRQPVNDSTILVELTNSSGLKSLYKTYTDNSGEATFDFTQWAGACVNIKVLYCPFCDVAGGDCGFAQCTAYADISNVTGHYTNIPNDAVTNPAVIPEWGSTTAPNPLNSNLYFPDLTTVSYCAPPSVQLATPAICLPLIIIFALLSGALYMTGRNPFASFNMGGGRVGKHIRYQARGRGFSMNVQSVATAASSITKVAEGPKDANGKPMSRLDAMKAEAKQMGGPLKAFGGPLISGTRSSAALGLHAQATALSKGGGKGSYGKALDTLANPQGRSTTQAAGTLVSRGNQQILTGAGGGLRLSDMMKGGAGVGGSGAKLDWKAVGLLAFTGSALGRIVDSYATIGNGNALMTRFLNDKDKAAARAQNDMAVIAMYNKQGGLSVALPNGSYGVLQPGSSKPDANGNITLVYNVLPEAGAAIMDGKVTPKTVTVTVAQELDAKGKPVLNSADPVTIKIVTPAKLDATGKILQPSEAKEYQVLAKTDPKGNVSFYIEQSVGGKPVQVPVLVEKNNVLTVAGQPVEITKGLPSNNPAAIYDTFGAKDGKMVNQEPELKIASIATAFSVAGSKEDIKVNIVPGRGPSGQESTIENPTGQKFDASMVKGYAEGVALKTMGVTTLADKGNAANLLAGQAAAFNDLSSVIDSFRTNSIAVQTAKADDWKDAEKKAWGELAREHPEALPAVRKAEQEIAADALASRGIFYSPAEVNTLPPEETKGRAFAKNNTEALFDIKQALESSVFSDPKKNSQMGAEIAAKFGVQSQGEVVAAAVTMMVNSGQSVDDLKKTNPETAKIFMQAAVDQALKNGTISPADASKLTSPAAVKEFNIGVQVEANSAGNILANDSEKQCRAGSGGRIERNTEHRCVHDSRVRARRSPCPACHGRSQCRKEDARGIYPSQRPSQPIRCQRRPHPHSGAAPDVTARSHDVPIAVPLPTDCG